MSTICYNILGGLWGWDGYLTSGGMKSFVDKQLSILPYTSVKTYTWRHWQAAGHDLVRDNADFKVLIGYSGGGMGALYLVNRLPKKPQTMPTFVDLMVLYDPSPPPRIEPLCTNLVRNALCYHNTDPRMGWPKIGKLGGGTLQVAQDFAYTGRFLQRDFAQQHLAVQSNQLLHKTTVAAVRALQIGTDPIAAAAAVEW